MSSVHFPPTYARREHSASLFLAGTIDMGNSEDWQSSVAKSLEKFDVDILNPRRPDWDNSWGTSIKDANFNEQVNWELDHLDASDIVLMYFMPDSMSPITLLELGLYANPNLVLVCPDEYWRSGNVHIVAERMGIKYHKTLDEGLREVKSRLIKGVYNA